MSCCLIYLGVLPIFLLLIPLLPYCPRHLVSWLLDLLESKKFIWGTRKMSLWFSALTVHPEDLRFPECTWHIPSIALVLGHLKQNLHMVHRHAFKQSTHTHKVTLFKRVDLICLLVFPCCWASIYPFIRKSRYTLNSGYISDISSPIHFARSLCLLVFAIFHWHCLFLKSKFNGINCGLSLTEVSSLYEFRFVVFFIMTSRFVCLLFIGINLFLSPLLSFIFFILCSTFSS